MAFYTDNTMIWRCGERVPEEFVTRITSGPLEGKSNINAQWRLKTLTELFGPCGVGWVLSTVRDWVHAAGGDTAVFVEMSLKFKYGGSYSEPVTGTGGSLLVKGGALNDEAYKMAETDAISVICRKLGIGSLIYEGKWDGSKYAGLTYASIPPAAELPSADIDLTEQGLFSKACSSMTALGLRNLWQSLSIEDRKGWKGKAVREFRAKLEMNEVMNH